MFLWFGLKSVANLRLYLANSRPAEPVEINIIANSHFCDPSPFGFVGEKAEQIANFLCCCKLTTLFDETTTITSLTLSAQSSSLVSSVTCLATMIQKSLRFCFLVAVLLALSTTHTYAAATNNLRARSLQEGKAGFFDTVTKWATTVWSFLDFGSDATSDEAPEGEIMRSTESPATTSPSAGASTFSPTSEASTSSSMDGSAPSSMDASSSSTLVTTAAST
jgi:hypothetical protein